MSLRPIRVLLLCLIGVSSALAAPQVQIAVKGPSGAAVANALVIVQDLDHNEREIFRGLADAQGAIKTPSLPPGLYRAIATYPYGQWGTSVREFLVSNQPVTLEIRLAERRGQDEIAVSFGQLTVHVVDAGGRPVAGARVLVRDAEAHRGSEHWGTTNAQGTTTLPLTMTPALLVVVSHDHLYTFPTAGLETERTLQLK